jgi:hypothetical protein
MSAFAGILKGAMRQGLSDINETNEFYNDLVRTASAHIGNATQAANNSFPEDVKAAEKKYTNYIALVETIGKDKADYIFENTNYLDHENWRELSTNAALGLGTEDGSPFKYYARVEPVDAIAKLANANINNVKNQIKNSSSLRGMNKVSDLYLPMLPQEKTFDTSMLPPSDGGSMTDAQRADVSKFVVLPTEITSIENQNLMYSKLIDKAGGDINKAATMFNVKPEVLAKAKSDLAELSTIKRAAIAMVDTTRLDSLRMNNADPLFIEAEIINVNNQINSTVSTLEQLGGVETESVEALEKQALRFEPMIDDNTEFNIGGKKVKFKEIVKIARKKDASISKLHVIMNLLQDKNFKPIQ